MEVSSSFCRCVVSDTAEYSAVATNSHGTATSTATVIVKSKKLFISSSFPFSLSVCPFEITFLLFLTGASGAGEFSHLGLGGWGLGRANFKYFSWLNLTGYK